MKNPRVILLLSGGFDSAVAGHLLQKKGYTIIPLHLSSTDFAGEESINKCVELSKMLAWEKMYVIDIADALQKMVDQAKHSYFFILMKRFMLRLAGSVAKIENIQFIATGESLGQVSSQTLANISAIEEATEFRVLKPLITFDKNEIIEFSKEIGTYEISTMPEICDVLGPKHPITNARMESVLIEEEKLDYESILTVCLKNKILLEFT